MTILYFILKYFNSLNPRLRQSTWRWSYDYSVIGEKDVSDLDDKNFVRLMRKKIKLLQQCILKF